MTVRARLYDADGEDRDVDLASPPKVGDRQLLWVDVGRDEDELQAVEEALDLPGKLTRLTEPARPPHVRVLESAFHLRVIGLAPGEETPDPVVLDLVIEPNIVITVHSREVDGLADFDEQVEGETLYGKLDAASLVGLMLDGMLSAYFRAVEGIESHIDELDEQALRTGDPAETLGELVELRRRIATLRRSLAPQREVFDILGRPDFELQSKVGTPWEGLIQRFERAVDSVENARELLMGSFDIMMTRAGQRTNDVMRVLTVVSSVLLPSVVIAGVMGMNFKVGFFEEATNFYVVIGAMLALAAAILLVARWRGWI